MTEILNLELHCNSFLMRQSENPFCRARFHRLAVDNKKNNFLLCNRNPLTRLPGLGILIILNSMLPQPLYLQIIYLFKSCLPGSRLTQLLSKRKGLQTRKSLFNINSDILIAIFLALIKVELFLTLFEMRKNLKALKNNSNKGKFSQ